MQPLPVFKSPKLPSLSPKTPPKVSKSPHSTRSPKFQSSLEPIREKRKVIYVDLVHVTNIFKERLTKCLEPTDVLSLFLTKKIFWHRRGELLLYKADFIERVIGRKKGDFSRLSFWREIFQAVGHTIKSLNLQRCTRMEAEDFVALSQLFPYLEKIFLPHTHLTDLRFLSFAKNLKLQVADISDNPKITLDKGGHLLLKELRVLLVSQNKVNDSALYNIGFHLDKLTYLDLAECRRFKDSGIQLFATYTRIRELNLKGCTQLTELSFQYVASIETLEKLNASGCQFTVNAAGYISKRISLRWLCVASCPLYDAGLKKLSPLKNLTGLDVSSCHITDEALPTIFKFQSLLRIYLEDNHLSERGIRNFTFLEREKLKTSNCKIFLDRSFSGIERDLKALRI